MILTLTTTKYCKQFSYYIQIKFKGNDSISMRVRRVKLSNQFIIKPLIIIFQNYLKSSIFPDNWKKGNIVPVSRKNVKRFVNNYHPVSMLPTCSKNLRSSCLLVLLMVSKEMTLVIINLLQSPVMF